MENFKKVAKSMNQAVSASEWDNKLMLKIEHTAFNPLHRVASGRNNVSKMLELQTVLTEASEVFFETEARSNTIQVFIYSPVAVEHGHGRYEGIFLRLKDARGKYHNIETKNAWERTDIQVDRLLNIFGVPNICTYRAEEFDAYCEEQRAKVIGLYDAKDVTENSEWVNSHALDQMRREFAKQYMQEIVQYELDSHHKDRFEGLCKHAGITVVRMFKYTQKFSVYRVDFLNVSDKVIEIGWTNSQTYNSLPEMLKISLVKEIKAVSLSDLGIEGAGYYSHDDRMSIRADQVDDAKAFARKFTAAKNKGLNKILKAA